MTSWAREIASLPTQQRGAATFGPYLVDPDGALRLPIEMLRRTGPRTWPIGEAPGWKMLSLPDQTDHRQWFPFGSEYFFRGNQPIARYACESMAISVIATCHSADTQRSRPKYAVPRCNRFLAARLRASIPPHDGTADNLNHGNTWTQGRRGVFALPPRGAKAAHPGGDHTGR
jgi:hypothetical protein